MVTSRICFPNFFAAEMFVPKKMSNRFWDWNLLLVRSSTTNFCFMPEILMVEPNEILREAVAMVLCSDGNLPLAQTIPVAQYAVMMQLVRVVSIRLNT